MNKRTIIRVVWMCGCVLFLNVLLVMPMASAQNVELTWAGASIGSSSYNHAAATAGIINRYSKRIKVNAIPTSGAVEMIRLLVAKRVDMGISNSQIGYQAYNSKGPFEKQPPVKQLRILWHMVAGVSHFFVKKDSNIRVVPDLRGKRIAHVRPGSSAYVQFVDTLEAFGMTLKDVKGYAYDHGEAISAFKDGNVDAVFEGGSLNAGPIMEAATSIPIRFLGLSDEDWVRMNTKFPPGYYIRYIIPANAYPNQPEAVKTFAIASYWSTTSDLPDDVGFELASLFFGHSEEAIKMDITIKETIEKQGMEAPVPWHSGSRRYLEARGFFK